MGLRGGRRKVSSRLAYPMAAHINLRTIWPFYLVFATRLGNSLVGISFLFVFYYFYQRLFMLLLRFSARCILLERRPVFFLLWYRTVAYRELSQAGDI